MRIVVIGAGVAGLAAAWTLSRGRSARDVTLVSSGAGASAMTSGAVDDVPWEDRLRATRLLDGGDAERAPLLSPLSAAARAFVDELGIWDVPDVPHAGAHVATLAGVVRPARGRDRSLLDLGPLADGTVIVPRVTRAGWDADLLCRSYAASSLARARGLAFRAVDVPVLRHDDERRANDMELAGRHDDDARLAWLATRLDPLVKETRAVAVLLGPWLGATAPRAEALSRRVGVPCGEALVGVGSPAGLRFEAARDAMTARLEAQGLRRLNARVTRVRRADEGAALEVHVIDREAPLTGDVVILATGGLVGGGILYAPPERAARQDLAPSGKEPFELSLHADVILSPGHGRQELVASMQGPELDGRAWPSGGRAGALERVGVGSKASGSTVWAVGDNVAGRPRTILEAVRAGVSLVGGPTDA